MGPGATIRNPGTLRRIIPTGSQSPACLEEPQPRYFLISVTRSFCSGARESGSLEVPYPLALSPNQGTEAPESGEASPRAPSRSVMGDPSDPRRALPTELSPPWPFEVSLIEATMSTSGARESSCGGQGVRVSTSGSGKWGQIAVLVYAELP